MKLFKDKTIGIDLNRLMETPSCENCGDPRKNPKRQKRFCNKKCLGEFYGKLNKGKTYKRHLKNYHGNQTSFKKGHINRRNEPGQRVSPDTEFKTGQIPWNKGKKHSEEAKGKMSEKKLGKYKGDKNPNWKGGTTPILMRLRRQNRYLDWRKAVFERDDYTCQECGIRGGRLNADHIKPFAFFPELRFNIDNGRTLCVECHRKTPTYGSRCRSEALKMGATI